MLAPSRCWEQYRSWPARIASASLVLALTSSVAGAETIAGRASVIDRDTIKIHVERIRSWISMRGIRSAFLWKDLRNGQAGAAVRRLLWRYQNWVGAHTVTCETTEKDRHKRWLARCSVAGADIALCIADNGWAVPYRNCKCRAVRQPAQTAKEAKHGIWSGTFAMLWD